MEPIPPHLKLLRGNPGKRRIFPSPGPDIPENPPDPLPFLSPYACEEWRRVGPELHSLGLLATVDLAAFGAYCEATGLWRMAVETIRTAPPAEAKKLSQLVREASKDMVRFAKHFGMTPSARAHVVAGTPRGSKFDGLLG